MDDVKLHVVFFHGLGDSNVHAKSYIERLCDFTSRKDNIKVIGYAHKYPTAFEDYLHYVIHSSVFFVTSVLLALARLTLFIIQIPLLLILSCLLCSVILLFVPFVCNRQGLCRSSIEKIDELIESGVKPEHIILFGHSFGGAVALEVLKHFAYSDKKLGGVVLTNTFSSFQEAIRNFRPFMPQVKLLCVLPSFVFKCLLRCCGLDFTLSDDINKLYRDNKLVQTVIMDAGEKDELFPEYVQLGSVLTDLISKGLVKIISNKASSHNYAITIPRNVDRYLYADCKPCYQYQPCDGKLHWDDPWSGGKVLDEISTLLTNIINPESFQHSIKQDSRLTGL